MCGKAFPCNKTKQPNATLQPKNCVHEADAKLNSLTLVCQRLQATSAECLAQRRLSAAFAAWRESQSHLLLRGKLQCSAIDTTGILQMRFTAI